MSNSFNAITKAYIDLDLFKLRNPGQLVKFLGNRVIHMHPTNEQVAPAYVPQWSTNVVEALSLVSEYDMRMEAGSEAVRGLVRLGDRVLHMEVAVLNNDVHVAWSEAVTRLAIAVEQFSWLMFGTSWSAR